MAPIRKRATRALTSLGLAAVLTAAIAGVAAAHHAEVSAEMDCDGDVTFTSSAWNGSTTASRTNPDIGVWYAVDGGSFTELVSSDYFFAQSNGFSFTDTIAAAGAGSVTIKVQAQANWGNGTGPGASRQVTAFAPQGCEPTPTPTPTPTPVPTPTPTPTPETEEPTPTPTPQTQAPTPTPSEGTLGGNPPTLPDTSAQQVDRTGAGLVAAGLALVLGLTMLVGEKRARRRSR